MAMQYAGANKELIGDSLGHGDLRTTENYLDSFVDEIKKEFAAKLTDFKTVKKV